MTELSRKSSMSLVWTWIIEELALSDPPNLHLLLELIGKAPQVSDGTDAAANEAVSLRILELLFPRNPETLDAAGSAPCRKTRFDPTQRCEDVLRHILHETSGLDSGKGLPDLSKWDVQPFIVFKKSLQPKSAMQQLKDAVIEGSNPVLASLSEKSGLKCPNQLNNEICIDGGHLYALPQNAKVASPIRETENNAVKHQYSENLPAKRIWTREGQPHGGGVVLNTERDSRVKQNKIKVGGTFNGIPLKNVASSNVINAAVRPNIFSDKDKVKIMHAGDVSPSGTIQRIEDNHQHKLSGDGQWFQDVINDIASERNAFLSSQCSHGQNSMKIPGKEELNLCKKCNKGGNLLICSSKYCSVVVHDSCLSLVPYFDEWGNFYCPFCAYSRAISTYLRSKEEASLKRKDLAVFVGSMQHHPQDEGNQLKMLY